MSNLALNNSLSSILANKQALDVISQNISNASNPNYSRQRAELRSNTPFLQNNNFFGSGTDVEKIKRFKDKILESRIVEENQNLGRFNQLKQTMEQIETVLNEPSDNGLRAKFSALTTSLNSVSNDPKNRGARTDLISKAKQFTTQMNTLNRQLKELGGRGPSNSRINQELQSTVDEINKLGQNIATLNVKISNAEGRGATPNDLLDQRDESLNELSKLVDTRVQRNQDQFRVNVNGFTFLQGGEKHELKFDFKNDNSDRRQVLFDDPGESVVKPKGGKLQGLLQVRDEIVPGIIDELNDMAVQYTDRFNDLHRSGFGRDGETNRNFFESLRKQESGVFRMEGIGERSGSIQEQRAGFIDSPDTVLTGDSTTIQPENFEEDEAVKASPEGTLTLNDETIQYDMSEDSIQDILSRINQTDNQVEAYLSSDNRLTIKGSQTNDFEIDRIKDSGLLMEKANILTVGGNHRVGVNGVDDVSSRLVDGANNFDGDPRIDNTQGLPGQGTLSSGNNVNVNVGNASLFTKGEKVVFQNDNKRIKTSVKGVNETSNDIIVDLNEDFDTAAGVNPDIKTFGDNLAQGTLEFDRAGGNSFAVNYDAEEDTLEDLVSRINTKASPSNESSRIRAGITDRNQFEVFSYESKQDLTDSAGPGDNSTVTVQDVTAFDVGEEVGFSDNNGGEVTRVEDINEDNGTITVDLNDTYNPADNAQVTADLDGNFRVDDVASQQLNSDATSGSNTSFEVEDPAEFSAGDDVILTNDNSSIPSETTTVTEVNESNGTVTVDSLSNTFTAGDNSAIRKRHTNEKRNLLNVLGMNREFDERRPGMEFATTGKVTRPPESEPAGNIRINEAIDNNPNFIAAAEGEDTDLDGINESLAGPGDGNNAQKLAELKDQEIMKSNTTSPEENMNRFVSDIGSQASLFNQEQQSSQQLTNDLTRQRQEISGVSIDEELTNLLQHQQAYQASARVISTVQQLNQSIIQLV